MSQEFDLSQVLSELSQGTKFQRVSESEVLHSHMKVRTPLHFLNSILGGGVPFGAIVEIYGPPASGKSTFSYSMLGDFQRQYPNGVPIIVDTEASADPVRLSYMGLDPSKILRLPALTLEDGFEQVLAILKKKSQNEQLRKLPVMILWDTIATAPTRAQYEQGRANAGGLTEKPRLIKHYLSMILPVIEEQPLLLVLLNQVFTDLSGYKPRLVSGGGMGLKHDIHLQLEFVPRSHEFVGESSAMQHSAINVTKSKLSPRWTQIPVDIDVRKGGLIDSESSFFRYLFERGYVLQSGGWYKFDPNKYQRYKEFEPVYRGIERSFRWADAIEFFRSNPNVIKMYELCVLDDLLAEYTYYKDIFKDYRDKLYFELLLESYKATGQLGPDATVEDAKALYEQQSSSNNTEESSFDSENTSDESSNQESSDTEPTV